MSDPTEPTEPAKKPAAKKAAAKKTSPAAAAPAKKTAAAKKSPAAKTSPAKKSTTVVADRTEKTGVGARLKALRRGGQDDGFVDPGRGPVLTPRSVIALVLAVGGIAWMTYFYVAVRVDPFDLEAKPGKPAFMADLGDWNYLIGFGAVLLALIVAAHPSTPLGRGRGVVVGMLGCFGVGLLWICTFYVISGASYYPDVPIFNDLDQKNLIVGIAFMAVGFTFATKWE